MTDEVKKPRQRRAKKSETAAFKLHEALSFVACAADNEGDIHRQHCWIEGGQLIATNGLLTAGYPVEETFNLCPHTLRLKDALARCGATLSITETENGRLLVKSGSFRAHVPAVKAEQLPRLYPDPNVFPIDDILKQGFAAFSSLIDEEAKQVHYAGITIMGGLMCAANGPVVLQFWHGLQLPPHMIVPKRAVMSIAKVEAKLIGFGYSGKSATFYFEGGGWIRSQLFEGTPLDWNRVFNDATPTDILPEDFGKALEAVAAFADEGTLHFLPNLLKAGLETNEGAEYVCNGLPPARVGFNAEYLKYVVKLAGTWQMLADRLVFVGGSYRGAIAGIRVKEEYAAAPRPQREYLYQPGDEQTGMTPTNFDDDVPF